jgi:hypothetical protein
MKDLRDDPALGAFTASGDVESTLHNIPQLRDQRERTSLACRGRKDGANQPSAA